MFSMESDYSELLRRPNWLILPSPEAQPAPRVHSSQPPLAFQVMATKPKTIFSLNKEACVRKIFFAVYGTLAYGISIT